MDVRIRRGMPVGRGTGNLPGRPAYRARFRAALRQLFPREALAEELKRRNLSPERAAKQTRVGVSTIRWWLRGKYTPERDTLTRFLDSLGIDRGPFESFLAAQAPLTLVCQQCGRARQQKLGYLRNITGRAKNRRSLKKRPDGAYEYLCQRCSARKMARTVLKPADSRRRERELKVRLGAKAEYLIEAAEQGDQDARKALQTINASRITQQDPRDREKFLSLGRGPKSDATRRKIALGNIVEHAVRGEIEGEFPDRRKRKGAITQPFHLCPLCGLITNRWQWHRVCWHTWGAWYRRNIARCRRPPRGTRPSPLRQRGPRPQTHLARNYAWLIASRGQSVVDRKIAQRYQEMLTSARKGRKSRATVTEGIKAFIRLLPGSWDLVFRGSMLWQRANLTRQHLVELPFEMLRIVGDGGRDPLIRRLLEFGMKEDDVARLTGMGQRVKGIAARMKAEQALAA